jgi:hypothetical protein
MDTNPGSTPPAQRLIPLLHAQTTLDVPLTEEQLQAVHVDGLTPLAQPIQIADYDPAWPRLFEREAARLQATLGDENVRSLLCNAINSPRGYTCSSR